MAKILHVIACVALVALQVAVAKPPKGGKQAPEKSQLEELTQTAQHLVNNVTETLGLKDLDNKKVVDALNTNAQTLAANVNEAVDKLKKEVQAHQPEVESALKSIEAKLTETATALQNAAGPDAAAKAKELRATLDSGLKTAVDQVEKLVKAVEPDATKVKNDVQNAAKTLLDQIVEISNNLQTQVKQTLADHEKGHKH